MSQEDTQLGELGLPLPSNHANLPRFCNLVRFFTSLAAAHGAGSTKLLQELVIGFINSWKKAIGNDIYPAVRLWFPKEDDRLSQLSRIKDPQLGKMIATALDLPAKSASALALTQVKRGNFGYSLSGEDGLAVRAKRAVDERFPVREYSALRIDEVIAKLEEFADVDKTKQTDLLRYFISTLNSDEFYWLIKIIQCNLAIRASEKTFLRAFHPNAEQVYMVNKSLETACHQLWSRDFSVTERDTSVRPLSFFCPMLAKYMRGVSIDFDSCATLMKHGNDQGRFYIEEKIDGERVQLHWVREGNITKFLSRRSLDHTESYQGIFNGFSGSSTVSMQDIVNDSVESVILDGEVVAWDPATNDLCGQSKVRELTHYVKSGKYKHMMYVFDVVYLNGEVLTDLPLKTRKDKLREVFTPAKTETQHGRMQMLPFKIGHSANDIATEFHRIISEMSEGLVVKNPESVYSLDARNNDWIKVKPEFVDGYAGENLDLVLVGAYRGSGKLQNKFGSYLLALRDETVQDRYVALGKVGSGICMAIHTHIDELINQCRFGAREPPPWLDMGTTELRPDFYIPAEQGLVIEIKYSEIHPPKTVQNYGAGYWLRFPRYVRIREDKNAQTATSVAEFLEIRSRRNEKSEYAQKKRVVNDHKISSVAKRVRQEEMDKVEIKSHIFAGHSFYCCGDIEQPEFHTERELANLIRENGGTVKSLPESGTYAISDRMVPKAAALLKTDEPIFHPYWIFDSIAANHLINPEPVHYFHGYQPKNTPDLVDQYGFSLQRVQPETELKRLVNAMDLSTLTFSEQTMKDALAYWKSVAPNLRAFTFTGFSFYIDSKSVSPSRQQLITSLVNYGSGEIVSDHLKATHVICDSPLGSQRVEFIRPSGSTAFVTSEWVKSSWFNCEISPDIKVEY